MAFNTFLKIIGQLWDSDLVGPASRCEQGCVLCWRTQLRVHYPPVPILSGCLPSLPVAPLLPVYPAVARVTVLVSCPGSARKHSVRRSLREEGLT